VVGFVEAAFDLNTGERVLIFPSSRDIQAECSRNLILFFNLHLWRGDIELEGVLSFGIISTYSIFVAILG
jgi:hypothetical protein